MWTQLQRLLPGPRRHNVAVRGACNGCGSCCRDLVLVDRGQPIRSRAQFRELVRLAPEFAIFRPRGLGIGLGLLHFSCTWLGSDNRCTRYAERPGICRDYPQAEILSMGAELSAECGYELVPLRSFAEVLEGERRRRGRRGWRRWWQRWWPFGRGARDRL